MEILFLSKLPIEWHKLQALCPEEQSEEKFFRKEFSKKVNEVKKIATFSFKFRQVFRTNIHHSRRKRVR